MPNTPSVGHLLSHGGSGISQIFRRAKELNRLTQRLKALVDEPLCDHIYVANVRDNTLVIGTDSAVWHTRVKYLAPMLLEQIKEIPELKHVRHITFRVQPFSASNGNNKIPETRSIKPTPESTTPPGKNGQISVSSREKNNANAPTLEQTLQGLSKKLKRQP